MLPAVSFRSVDDDFRYLADGFAAVLVTRFRLADDQPERATVVAGSCFVSI
jgi:hypothetical protein